MIYFEHYFEISTIISFFNKGDTTEELFYTIERVSTSANEKKKTISKKFLNILISNYIPNKRWICPEIMLYTPKKCFGAYL